MKNPSYLFGLLFLLVTVISSGCTLITDFPEYGDSGTDVLYSLADNVANPVQVVLINDKDAVISLDLDESLPETSDDDSVLEQLLASSITLTLKNKDSGTTVDLTQGTRVKDEPDSPGEYRISTNADRNQISVQFFNQIQNGRSLRADGDYEAVVEVRQNNYLVAEELSRDVTVQSQK